MSKLTLEDIGIIETKKTGLTEFLVDTTVNLDRPPTILSIKENEGTRTNYRRICTLGNFSVLKGKKKARKSFLASLFAGTCLRKTDYSDILHSEMPDNKKFVAYFDTEQGQFDSQITMKRIEKIGGKGYFKGYNFRKISPLDRCKMIEEYLKEFGKETGLIVIDGVRDLVTAINDETEATRIVNLLLKWTDEYNLHMIVIIHENKADGNSRGHIGTEIENRSEICISVEAIKDSWYSSRVKCDFSRSMGFKEFTLNIDNELYEHGIPYAGDFIPELKTTENINEYMATPEAEDYPF